MGRELKIRNGRVVDARATACPSADDQGDSTAGEED